MPVPIPAFDGESWTHLDGRIWATLTYLPGRSLFSEPDLDLEAASAFLATYHRASRQTSTKEQRPTSSVLKRLREFTSWERLRAALGSAAAVGQYERLLRDLEDGRHELQYETIEQLVIHGDPTNDSLIVDGDLPRIVGLIDFGAASLAPWPARLAAGLWRSSRASESDVGYDPDRVTRFVSGYHRESLIPTRLARALPQLIQAHGLGLISRRVWRFPTPSTSVLDYITLTLALTAWVFEHRQDFVTAVAAAAR